MKKRLFVCLMVTALALSGCAAEKAPDKNPATDAFMDASSGEFTFKSAGDYGPSEGVKSFAGNLLVDAENVVLRNVNVTGNLTISENVGDGDASLESVSIDGTLYINGGGENSIRIRGGNFPVIEINRPDGRVRIVTGEEAEINAIVVLSSAKLETDKVAEIIISPDDGETAIEICGLVQKLTVKQAAKVTIGAGAAIDAMVIEANAQTTEVDGEGSIAEARIDAEDVRVDARMDEYHSKTFPDALYINGIPEDWGHSKAMDDVNAPSEAGAGDSMTKDNWEVGLPWNAEWGEAPDGAWDPDSGVPWDPAWGDAPNDEDANRENPDEAPTEPANDNAMTKDNWEVGLPWNAEWGEAPDGAWDPDSGVPWDPAWGDAPNDEDANRENPDEDPLSFIVCDYKISGNSISVELSLNKPATVHYVFEDLSGMMGSGYLPTMDQVIKGQNATGSPLGMKPPETGDDMGFPPEALLSGVISVAEANTVYEISLTLPADSSEESPSEDAPPEMHPSDIHGSFVAIDDSKNLIMKQ